MTRVFAELSEHREPWLKALEGLGMMKSPLMESARQEGRKEGHDEGLKEGLKEGRVQLLRDQLMDKFGPLSPKTVERLKAMAMEQHTALGRALIRAESLRDLGLE